MSLTVDCCCRKSLDDGIVGKCTAMGWFTAMRIFGDSKALEEKAANIKHHQGVMTSIMATVTLNRKKGGP